MKYKDFYGNLNLVITKVNEVYIGPCISIMLEEHPKISISKFVDKETIKYIIFPIKIYGKNIRHLNILFFDKKKKIIERFEPFNKSTTFKQINGLLESLLYKLMNMGQIYFLKYQTTLNYEKTDNKNCGWYCIQYVLKKINALSNHYKLVEN